jgi:hypothetical protein
MWYTYINLNVIVIYLSDKIDPFLIVNSIGDFDNLVSIIVHLIINNK